MSCFIRDKLTIEQKDRVSLTNIFSEMLLCFCISLNIPKKFANYITAINRMEENIVQKHLHIEMYAHSKITDSFG